MTAEGLFRAALDGLPGVAGEIDDMAKSQRSAGAVPLPALFASPLHPYSKAAMLRGYSELLLQWEKREAEGEAAARRAENVRTTASFSFTTACWRLWRLSNALVVSNDCPAQSAVSFEYSVSGVAPQQLIRPAK